MSDHADVIRALLLDMGNGDTSPEQYDTGLAALDALVAEREVDRQRWADTDHLLGQALARAEAAEAELSDRDNQYREACNCWKAAEARVTVLEAALRDLNEYAARMPGYSLHPLTERARAALADLAKEGT